MLAAVKTGNAVLSYLERMKWRTDLFLVNTVNNSRKVTFLSTVVSSHFICSGVEDRNRTFWWQRWDESRDHTGGITVVQTRNVRHQINSS
jgi:hypothetical protein